MYFSSRAIAQKQQKITFLSYLLRNSFRFISTPSKIQVQPQRITGATLITLLCPPSRPALTSMMFYTRPVALNRAQHRNLTFDTRGGDFGFARHTNSILLAASEIGEAARDYPVVFVAGAGDTFTLAALLGLRDGENLFVDAAGKWDSCAYVPAFARRYPFVLAEGGAGDTELTVCIDEASDRLGEHAGEPLFDANGMETALLQSATEFLTLFHREMQQTALFAKALFDAGLLVPKTIEIVSGERHHLLDGLFVVDREQLAALDDARVLELTRNGAMYAIHAHLVSLGQVERLAQRLERLLETTSDSALASTSAP